MARLVQAARKGIVVQIISTGKQQSQKTTLGYSLSQEQDPVTIWPQTQTGQLRIRNIPWSLFWVHADDCLKFLSLVDTVDLLLAQF